MYPDDPPPRAIPAIQRAVAAMGGCGHGPLHGPSDGDGLGRDRPGAVLSQKVHLPFWSGPLGLWSGLQPASMQTCALGRPGDGCRMLTHADGQMAGVPWPPPGAHLDSPKVFLNSQNVPFL